MRLKVCFKLTESVAFLGFYVFKSFLKAFVSAPEVVKGIMETIKVLFSTKYHNIKRYSELRLLKLVDQSKQMCQEWVCAIFSGKLKTEIKPCHCNPEWTNAERHHWSDIVLHILFSHVFFSEVSNVNLIKTNIRVSSLLSSTDIHSLRCHTCFFSLYFFTFPSEVVLNVVIWVNHY